MPRPSLEVADIFRDHGPAWRQANRGCISHEQYKVMNAIERCRTAALGGHVARCTNAECGHTLVVYNSCRNRHCPKCQGAAAREWLEAREAELLPVPYFHCVFSLPAEIADIPYHNKAVVYDLLLRVSAEVMTTIAADPVQLGLVEPVDRLGERVVIGVTDAADRRHEASLGQTLRILDRDVLHAAIGVVDETAARDGPSIVEGLLQRVQHEAGMG